MLLKSYTDPLMMQNVNYTSKYLIILLFGASKPSCVVFDAYRFSNSCQ